MVERLDAPQPVYPLPPLENIPDEAEDKPLTDKLIITSFGEYGLPAVIFGAATFSAFYNTDDQVSGVTPLRTTRLALRYGIRAFDTSPYYGPSEIILGNALKTLENEFPRSSYQLLTKCGRYGNTRADFDLTPEGIRASVQRSLTRLHTDYLDTVYVHDVEFIAYNKAPKTQGNHLSALDTEKEAYGLAEGQEAIAYGDGDTEILGAISELMKLKDEGIIRRVGISGYPLPTLLRLAILVLHSGPCKPLDVVMSYCHLNLQNRTVENFKAAFLERAKVKQVISASPFSMGLLAPQPPAWHPAPEDVKKAAKEAVERCAEWPGNEEGYSALPTLALEYAFERARRAKIPTVVGLSSLKDVHESAQMWYEVEEGALGKEADWNERVNAVTDLFRDRGLLDYSWENPAFSSG
ncbi:Aldo/keto reductase family-domain-containing protein [Phlebopus sp. FC_14]|nr:Aldo/keto reductase family-domain-containing protein [Phlebopus sp. FC_14]